MKQKDEDNSCQVVTVQPGSDVFDFVHKQTALNLAICFPLDRSDVYVDEQMRKHPELEVIERLLKTLKEREGVHQIEILYKDDEND